MGLKVNLILLYAWALSFSLSETFLFWQQTLNVNSTDPSRMVADKNWGTVWFSNYRGETFMSLEEEETD